MTIPEQIFTIGICAGATMLTRFAPFLLFSQKRPVPEYIQYLGRTLPSSVFAMLVIYCIKDVSPEKSLPETIAIMATVLLHLWRGHFLLSMAGGTICYMAILRIIA